MESLHRLLVERRSIRRYTEQPLDPDTVKTILEAALLSPTGKNSRAWHFVVTDNKDMLEKLSECKAASNMMLQARDLGVGSCWIEVNGRLTADGTPAEDIVQELLGIPEHIQPLCIVTFGYPDETRQPQNCDKLLWERVHIGSFRHEQC